MDPQSRWIDRTTSQAETPFIRIRFWCSTQSEDQNQDEDALLRLETNGKDKKMLEDSNPELLASYVQHTDPLNNDQDGSSADKYFVCEVCDLTVPEMQHK